LAALLVLACGLAVLALGGVSSRAHRGGAYGRRYPVPENVVFGYVSGVGVEMIKPSENAIRDACGERGWALARLVRDHDHRSKQALTRPGLRFALDRLAEGGAGRLVVHRLDHVANSVRDLRAVLDWFMTTGIVLTVLDVELDTATAEGRTAARSLLSVAEAEEEQRNLAAREGLAGKRSRAREVPQR
jgi:DNA invertase Pin-like site-specific DNA recombinase